MATTIDYASDYDGEDSDYQTTMKRLSTMDRRLQNDYPATFWRGNDYEYAGGLQGLPDDDLRSRNY